MVESFELLPWEDLMDGMLSFEPEKPLDVVSSFLRWPSAIGTDWNSQADPMKLKPRQTFSIAHVILSPPLGVIPG